MKKGSPPSYISTSRIRTVSLIIIGTEHYGKKKFDSERAEETEIRTEISFDPSILKKRNKQSFVVESKMGNSWKIAILTAEQCTYTSP